MVGHLGADDRSPTTLAGAEIRLRLHVRPWFADRPIDKITPADVRRWQAQLARNLGPSTAAHCRSLALRIFQFAMDEGAIDTNPVRKVPPPRRRAVPDQVPLGDGDHGHGLFPYCSAAVSMVSPEPKCGPPPTL